jgi:hypothetical protein
VIALREDCQYTDPPHSLGLLRARGERPCGRRATEKTDELAPPHWPAPPVLRTKRIAHLTTAAEDFELAYDRFGSMLLKKSVMIPRALPFSILGSGSVSVFVFLSGGATDISEGVQLPQAGRH